MCELFSCHLWPGQLENKGRSCEAHWCEWGRFGIEDLGTDYALACAAIGSGIRQPLPPGSPGAGFSWPQPHSHQPLPAGCVPCPRYSPQPYFGAPGPFSVLSRKKYVLQGWDFLGNSVGDSAKCWERFSCGAISFFLLLVVSCCPKPESSLDSQVWCCSPRTEDPAVFQCHAKVLSTGKPD